ncbi:hypothetical protein HNR62_000500 [Oceanisphaera litoralis]|uniref:hypothetical protein n=1 Tax=Oceanisphaera litoralis TaxID=225144 RepID=UPI001956684B|nr:hypothetical protein [Oceanisphaera litoralis]MBM7454671.1 hypothetical protein [Oceanisphaera litoralis]
MRDRLTGPKLVQIMLVLGILSTAFWLRTYIDVSEDTALEQENTVFCDISHKKCRVQRGEWWAEARLQADRLQPESPFQLTLTFSDPAVKVIRSRLEGETMYMGTLPALISESTPGHWQGQALVGACTERSMVWAWVLDIEHNGEPQQLKFLFEVKQ